MPVRYLLVAGTFLLSMLLYVDRVCISAAKGEIAADLRFNDRQMGWVFAAFSLGYALFQAPAGMLSDRFGPRRVLTAVVACWSLFTALTAAARGLGTMLAARFLFGAGEAGAFPGMARAIYAWLPMAERGLAQGVNFSAARMGAAVAMPGVAWMVDRIGWRATFVVLGVVGLVWAWGWYLGFRDDPAAHPGLSDEERGYILDHRQARAAGGPGLTVGVVLGSADMWLLMGQYFASNFTFFFCLTWLLPHLAARYGLSSTEAGGYAMVPLLAGMVGNWAGGASVDAIYRRGHWRASRRAPGMIGFALAGIGLLASLAFDRPGGVVACLALAVFGADMTLSPSWSACIDIGRRHAGAVSGTMNMAGNLGAFVTALAFPYLEQWTDSTRAFFLVGAGLDLLAVVAWRFTRADRPLGGS